MGRRLLAAVLAVSAALAAGGEALADPPVRFGARADAPPISYRTEDGQFRGYAIDICEATRAAYQRRHPDREIAPGYVEVTAADREAKLADGSIDMICGPFSITAERMERFDYSFLIFASGAGVATRREVSTLLQPSVKAAKERPAQVVVVSETTTEALVQTLLGTAVDIMRMPTHTAAYDALSSGKADFYFGDRVILNAVAARSKLGKDIVVGGKFLTYEPYALPVLRGRNQDLLRAANLAIAALYRDGGIENVYKSHFPDQRPSDLLQALFQLYALPER